jgi:hypothetical protein
MLPTRPLTRTCRTCRRWQKFSNLALSAATLAELAQSCDEFLVHGVDVEGMQLGIDDKLVALLGEWSPIPVTYAGGARTIVRGSLGLPGWACVGWSARARACRQPTGAAIATGGLLPSPL